MQKEINNVKRGIALNIFRNFSILKKQNINSKSPKNKYINEIIV